MLNASSFLKADNGQAASNASDKLMSDQTASGNPSSVLLSGSVHEMRQNLFLNSKVAAQETNPSHQHELKANAALSSEPRTQDFNPGHSLFRNQLASHAKPTSLFGNVPL